MTEEKLAGKSIDELFYQVVETYGSEVSEDELKAIEAGKDNFEVPPELMEEGEGDPEDLSIYEAIRTMKVPQKIKLALFGNKTARSLLLREKLRIIPLFVLQNNRITEGELEQVIGSKGTDENLIRVIQNNSKWMKPYSMKKALLLNTKTPVDIGLKWLKFIHEKDMRIMAKSKNISSVIASQCRRILDSKRR